MYISKDKSQKYFRLDKTEYVVSLRKNKYPLNKLQEATLVETRFPRNSNLGGVLLHVEKKKISAYRT